MKNNIAFVFPGQGSQTVGMLSDIAQEFSEVEKLFSVASRILGYDLWRLVQEGPEEKLAMTVHTQPALLAASVAIWKICESHKITKPVLLAGHSLGEYSALVCAEAVSFEDAIRVVAARGQFMQDAVAVGEGALAAIVGLDDAQVKELCDQARGDQVLAPANFNCPGQIVVAGHAAAVDRILALAKDAGARLAKLLPVSVPSHCELMQPAAKRLAELLQTISIQTPRIPVIHNVDVHEHKDANAIRNALTQQLFSPVRWVETIQVLQRAGIKQVVECGPGKVLTGLNKRIDASLQLTSTADADSLRALLNKEHMNV